MALKKRRLWADPDFVREIGVLARRNDMTMSEFTKEMKPDLTEEFGFDADFIETKVGIRQVYIAEDQTVSELATLALEKLLARRPELRAKIDLLVVCTQTSDFQLPQTSSQVQTPLEEISKFQIRRM